MRNAGAGAGGRAGGRAYSPNKRPFSQARRVSPARRAIVNLLYSDRSCSLLLGEVGEDLLDAAPSSSQRGARQAFGGPTPLLMPACRPYPAWPG